MECFHLYMIGVARRVNVTHDHYAKSQCGCECGLFGRFSRIQRHYSGHERAPHKSCIQRHYSGSERGAGLMIGVARRINVTHDHYAKSQCGGSCKTLLRGWISTSPHGEKRVERVLPLKA